MAGIALELMSSNKEQKVWEKGTGRGNISQVGCTEEHSTFREPEGSARESSPGEGGDCRSVLLG